MPDLRVTVDGLRLPNPFVIASGPPGTNANVIARAFREGWGAVVAKTVSLDASKIVNVAPRYARMRAAGTKEVVGWENIELISDRPLEVWEREFRAVKDEFPDGVLVASIMEEPERDRWVEIVERCEAAGVDGFEINFSCPHGLPERRMGSAMGEDPEMVEAVSGWVTGATRRPVWAKLTPNVTHIVDPGRAALAGGCSGLTAINTVLGVMGIDLETLRPEPTVEGYSVPGGYSGKAVRPIALRLVMELATMMFGGGCGAPIPDDGAPAVPAAFPDRSLSAIGGVESGGDAAQFILLGAHTVQVCTGVMIHGYGLIRELRGQLEAFMERHGFDRLEEVRGHSLQWFTTHAELVRRQAEARAAAKAGRADVVADDAAWEGRTFTEQTDRLVANR